MKIKPLGFYVLIEMEEIETTSAGGIILSESTVNKEQEATDQGWVRAIGPTAYNGYPGCEDEKDLAGSWGVKIGDKVEYRKYEGKRSSAEGYENYRYINDSHIIGVIEDD